MTAIIPYFILLLTAYTFSAPVGQENENSTIGWELTTGQANISTDSWWNGQSTGLPIVQKQRPVGDSNSNEVTTDYVTRPPRAALTGVLAMRDPPPKSSKTSSSRSYPKRGNDYSSNSEESGSNEKRDSEESLISTSTKSYKKRSDAAYQDSFESENNEKRESSESVLPTSSKDYKKRSDAASQDSFESENNEKRDLEESLISTSTKGYKKRSDAAYQDSFESENSEKRESTESLISTSTSGYKTRSDAAYQDSFESENNEKRESSESVLPTSTKGYKKRSDAASQESVENESSEKRDSKQYLISTSTSGYKKNTPKSYLFTTLESSTVFNRRAIRPVESQEEPESTSVYPAKQMQMNTNVKPSSSVDSFGKATGLLNNKPVDQSSEESHTPLPIQTQKITKTVSIIPGKVRETKFVTSVPTKSSVMMQPIQQEQLSQGQSQSES